MIGISGGRRIFLAAQPIDFRKGMDTIAALVSEALKADPFCGAMFIFRPKRCDRLKILVWDGSGLILATKRLEEGGFCWPARAQRDDAGRLKTAWGCSRAFPASGSCRTS
jgi:transposase